MKKKFEIDSDDPVTILKAAHQALQQAEAWRNERQLDRAEKMCLSLLKQFPDYYGALHTIGLVYGDKGDRLQAVHYLVQAAMLNPRSWTTLTALAGEYLLVDAKEMAIRTLHDALKVNSSEPAIYVMLAQIYYDQREYLLASDTYAKALELAPNMDEAIYGFANVSIELGRYEDAQFALERLLKLKPPSLQMLKLLVGLPPALVDRDLLDDLEKVKLTPGADSAHEESDKQFVRAVALDKMERHQEAWQWAVKANQTVRAGIKQDIAVEMRVVANRLNWVRENASKFNSPNSGDKTYPKSLFILGLSRSGKTTAESLISTQAGVMRGYENPAIDGAITTGFHMGGLITFKSLAQLPLQLYPVVRDEYRRNITKLLGDGKLVTNTSPGHIWDTPFFINAVPNMRFVFVKRNRDDLMLRIYMRRYKFKNTYSYDLATLDKYISIYNELIDVLADTFPDVTCVINYEDVVADPKAVLKKMSELCGIKPNYKALPKQIPNDIGCSEPYKKMMKAALDQDRF